MNEGLPAILLSIAVVAAFLLFAGGIRMIWRGDRRRGLLMLVAALVLFANVAVWTVPLPAT